MFQNPDVEIPFIVCSICEHPILKCPRSKDKKMDHHQGYIFTKDKVSNSRENTEKNNTPRKPVEKACQKMSPS